MTPPDPQPEILQKLDGDGARALEPAAVTERNVGALTEEAPTERARAPLPLAVPRRSALMDALDRLEDLAFAGDPRFEALDTVPEALLASLPSPTLEALRRRLKELEQAYWPRAIRINLGACWELLRRPRGLEPDAFQRRLTALERSQRKAKAAGLDRAFDPDELSTLRILRVELEWAHRLADVDEVSDPQSRRDLIDALGYRAARLRSEIDTARTVRLRLEALMEGGLDAWLRRRGSDLRLVPEPVAQAARDLQRDIWCLQALVGAQARVHARTERTFPGLALSLTSVVARISTELRIATTALPMLEEQRLEVTRLMKASSLSPIEGLLRFPPP